jgi:CubicO group peptidase (beta-lactamase class C family)
MFYYSHFSSVINIIIICLISPESEAFDLGPSQIQQIDSVIENEFIPLSRIPGAGLSIVLGNVSHSRGYGYSNLEDSVLASYDTLFGIGSISKVI